MGHSSVSLRGKHICAKDFKVQVWLFLLVREIDNMPEIEFWLKEARDFWQEEATLFINGCLDPELERFLTDNERLKLTHKLCQSVHENLLAHGNKISKDFLNQLCGCKPPCDFQIDNDTELYLRFSRALLKLLEGNQMQEMEYA
ncbi:MAG: hypothetical protein H7Z11_12565 [Verrucomicrobia bacterium]|nr:hypothetical protein [Leptolyngbya sp. ES-bin-22]